MCGVSNVKVTVLSVEVAWTLDDEEELLELLEPLKNRKPPPAEACVSMDSENSEDMLFCETSLIVMSRAMTIATG